MVKKSSTRVTEPVVTLTPVPLDADAYYVEGYLTDLEMKRIRLSWVKLNEGLAKAKPLIVLPRGTDLKVVPSSILRKLMDDVGGVLRERGEK